MDDYLDNGVYLGICEGVRISFYGTPVSKTM